MSRSILPRRVTAYRLLSQVHARTTPGQLVFWCPYCEQLHYHGAAYGGLRGAHCEADPKSPLREAGVDLDIIDFIGRQDGPSAPPMHRFSPLRIQMIRGGAALAKTAARFICASRNMGGLFEKRIGAANLTMMNFGWRWFFREADGQIREGRGLLTLGAALYGIPPGVVAVRLLEVFTFRRFDARTAFAIQDAIDAWVAAGAPERGGCN